MIKKLDLIDVEYRVRLKVKKNCGGWSWAL